MASKAKQIDEAAFAADVRAGMNTRQLGDKYGIAWQTAKKLRDQVETGGGASAEPDVESAETSADGGASEGAAEENSDKWSIDLSIRKDLMAKTLEKLDDEEIAAAVLLCDEYTQTSVLTAVMQRRLDAELADN